MAALQDKINVIADWHPNSVDMSAIERFWGILKAGLAERAPQSVAELRIIGVQKWQRIDQDAINGLVRSIQE